jgi:hypothetical protein
MPPHAEVWKIYLDLPLSQRKIWDDLSNTTSPQREVELVEQVKPELCHWKICAEILAKWDINGFVDAITEESVLCNEASRFNHR